MYDTGPGSEVNRAVRVILLTTCHTELKSLGHSWLEAPDGWLQAFDVHVNFDPVTLTLTVTNSGKCNE